MRTILAVTLLIATMRAGAADVLSILRDRVEVRKETVGIAVAIVTPESTTFHTYGSSTKNGNHPVDPQTVFRLASATKALTGVLLADMVRKGEANLDDPVAKYLPANVTVPRRNGKEITLRHLATHRSGLPRIPGNYRDDRPYGPEDLYAFLAKCELQSDPGDRFAYSNLGAALLGLALARRAGTSYEELVTTRISSPLHMTSTRVRITTADEHLAQGHDTRLRPQRFHPSVDSLAGASELVSDVRDLAAFASAALGSGSIHDAFELSAQPLASRDEYHADIGFGWWIDRRRDKTIVWHGGESRDGYKSFIGFDRDRRTAVIVLSNSRNGIEDIGFHLLDQRLSLDPWGELPRTATAVPVNDFVGRFEVRPAYTITMENRRGVLFGHAAGRPRRLTQDGPDHFRLDGDTIAFTFLRDDAGTVTSVIMSGGGQNAEGKRLP